MPAVRSPSANANGPGDPGGGDTNGAGRDRAQASEGAVTHGFAARSCQQTNAIRPPGRTTACRLANAATGSSKNITPNRDTTVSIGRVNR